MAAGYEIRVDGGTPIDVGNVLTFNVSSLDPNTLYAFEIRTYDDSGTRSGWSSIIYATTDTGLPHLLLNGDRLELNGLALSFNP